jgi:hypothetical protein
MRFITVRRHHPAHHQLFERLGIAEIARSRIIRAAERDRPDIPLLAYQRLSTWLPLRTNKRESKKRQPQELQHNAAAAGKRDRLCLAKGSRTVTE